MQMIVRNYHKTSERASRVLSVIPADTKAQDKGTIQCFDKSLSAKNTMLNQYGFSVMKLNQC